MKIVLPSCTIRDWRAADASSLAQQANNRAVWRNLKDRFPHPYALRDAEEWIRDSLRVGRETQFAIAVGGKAVGAIGLDLMLDIYRRSASIGYWLGESYWGRGIATDAVRAMTAHAFQSFGGLCRVQATVFEWNPASMRVLEKAGYRLEGRLRKSVTKDGETIDSVLYAIVRE